MNAATSSQQLCSVQCEITFQYCQTVLLKNATHFQIAAFDCNKVKSHFFKYHIIRNICTYLNICNNKIEAKFSLILVNIF